MIVVLDTNVLVSGLITEGNPPGQIVDLLRVGQLQLAVDDRILAEYDDVLSRPYFSRYFTQEEKDRVLNFIRSDSARFICTQLIHGLPDKKDSCFAETAMAARAPLVTGNLKHFPANRCSQIRVLTPTLFLKVFDRM